MCSVSYTNTHIAFSSLTAFWYNIIVVCYTIYLSINEHIMLSCGWKQTKPKLVARRTLIRVGVPLALVLFGSKQRRVNILASACPNGTYHISPGSCWQGESICANKSRMWWQWNKIWTRYISISATIGNERWWPSIFIKWSSIIYHWVQNIALYSMRMLYSKVHCTIDGIPQYITRKRQVHMIKPISLSVFNIYTWLFPWEAQYMDINVIWTHYKHLGIFLAINNAGAALAYKVV